MRLETERLIIRPWTMDDVEAAFTIYGDPEVMRYVGTGQAVPDLESMTDRLGKIIARDHGKPYGLWALERKQDGIVIGGGLLKALPDESDIEVGYHLAKAWWSQGYATEAARRLVQYGVDDLQLKRIVGVTYPENKASMRVLEKAGLVHQGLSKYLDIDVEFFILEA